MIGTTNNPGLGHEDGAIETSHWSLKHRLDQAIKLRGSADFASVVTGAGIAANRTKRTTALARPDFDFKEQPRGLLNQADGAEHKTMM